MGKSYAIPPRFSPWQDPKQHAPDFAQEWVLGFYDNKHGPRVLPVRKDHAGWVDETGTKQAAPLCWASIIYPPKEEQ